MSLTLRVVLIMASLLTMLFMLKRIRNAKVQIEDVIYWIVFSFLLLILSVFPQIAKWCADLLGIYSTVNFIFLAIIFLLLLREFSMTIKVSQMENKIKELTQEIAIKNNITQQEKEGEK